jgi:hypothetical protein
MRWILIFFVLFSIKGYSQLKDYTIGIKGDTLNAVDMKGMKQGKWVMRYDEIRGEPGFEEEGIFENGRKEGLWRQYSLMGDLIAIENFKWGYKDGMSQYFNGLGELIREESWRALNPDKQFDTLDVEEVDNPDHFRSVIVKNEGAGIKHGTWKYYDPTSGFISKTETYILGKLEVDKKSKANPATAKAEGDNKGKAKPKEVLDFEKKNSGKKKIKVKDGSTGF